MAVEIDAIQSAKSIGWTDALLSRLAANSVGLGARLSITAPANSSALSSTGYSLTGSNASSMIDLAGTWNTTGTPTLIKANVTNTASGNGSSLIDFQVAATSRYKIGFPFGVAGPVVVDVGGSNLLFNENNVWDFRCAGNQSFKIATGGVLTLNVDTIILRDAANTLALRNSTAAQAFNVYGTYTSGSVYERGAVYADSNGFNIAHQQLGSTKRPVRILGHDLASAEAVSALEINQTWNTSGNPVGLKMAITNTASGATAKFLSCLAGASGTTEILAIDKTGRIIGDGANPYLELSQANGSRLQYGSFNYFFAGGSTTIGTGGNGLSLIGTLGTAIVQTDAANTLALRNAGNAQAFRLYGTYTDASNYRRLITTMSTAGVAEIKPDGAGTGASGNVLHISGLPTSNPGPGILWNNAGTPAIGT